ncbi:MAG: 16S rRNA (cytosine(1402)-N(4))-methyltransferase RsmH [Myxococcales bacterium]
MEWGHATVLRDEVARLLSPTEGALVLDGTLGAGGHSEALLEMGARVLGLDRDPSALAIARKRLAKYGDRFDCEQATFAEARQVLDRRGISAVRGLVLDLGFSSMQIDAAERGFAFAKEGPLDMRMGQSGETARGLLARVSEEELAGLLKEYGEEPFARKIARAIKSADPLPETTAGLAQLVGAAIPRKAWPKNIHPATRTFQALRIAVNAELEQLDAVLAQLPSLLEVGGRAAIISFHSLEDRKVKTAFRALEGRCICPPGLPVCGCGAQGTFVPLTKKAVVPTEEEALRNPRARSAKLRAVEKVR